LRKTFIGQFFKAFMENLDELDIAKKAKATINRCLDDMVPTIDSIPGDDEMIREQVIGMFSRAQMEYTGNYSTAPTLYLAKRILEYEPVEGDSISERTKEMLDYISSILEAISGKKQPKVSRK
jgi:hypothetical protein